MTYGLRHTEVRWKNVWKVTLKFKSIQCTTKHWPTVVVRSVSREVWVGKHHKNATDWVTSVGLPCSSRVTRYRPELTSAAK